MEVGALIGSTRKLVPNFSTHFLRKKASSFFQVLEDYSMVKFVPLNSDDEESIEQLLLVIDTTIQYGEDLEVI